MSALERCIEIYGKKTKRSLSTLYIGGGTPSVLTPYEISSLLDKIHSSFDTNNLEEATLECNPESVSKEFLQAAKNGKIDRISMGIQSFDDKELSAIGRLHNSKQAAHAISVTKEQGFKSISCDLIFGLPHQNIESFEKSLETLVNTGVEHISCYNLQVEEGTPLSKEKLPLPNEDIQRQMYLTACSYLADKGYRHYEISNFAKQGFLAKHNSKYWDISDYLGLGPSAHSKIGNMRMSFDGNIEKFVSKKDFDFDTFEQIDDPFFEKVMLSLRTDSGLDMSLIKKSGKYIDMICKNGFAMVQNGFLKLTDEGFYLSNTIISDIIAKEC